MTSRERLLAALLRKPVDRVPISTYELVPYGSGWPNNDPSYASLMDFIREHTDVMMMWGPGGGGGLGHFITATEEVKAESRSWQEGESTHHEVIVHTPKGPLRHRSRIDPGVQTTWRYERFIKTDDDIERLLSIPYVPGTCDASGMSAALEQLGDRGILLISIGDPICHVAELFRFEDFMERAFTNRASIERLLDAFFPRVYDSLRQMLEQGVGPLFRICGPEYVTPPYLPPELFRAFVVKYDQPLIDLIHQHDCYARVHCHGRIGRVMEMIAEMGADATDPVEPPPCGDATLAEVKRAIGDRVCLMGGMELRDLEWNTPQEIDRLVREAIESAGPTGYVLMPTAAPINTPLRPQTERNYRAMIEAGLKYGQM